MILSSAVGWVKEPEPLPLIDCGNGIHNASIDLILEEGQGLSTASISGNKNISMVKESDGKLTVSISHRDTVIVHIPSGESMTATQLQILPEDSLLFEDQQVIYDVSNIHNKDVSEVQINAFCKK